jgi:D-xylose transport system ATP-binding protein
MAEAVTQARSDPAPLLEMRRITKDFPGVRALDDVSFSVLQGEIHALVGENGAGKSTLIKILGGVYPPGSFGGSVLLDGKPVHFRSVRDSEQAGIAIIHQELNLVPFMSVAENIFLGAEPSSFGVVDHNRMIRDADELMRSLGLVIDVRSEVLRLGIGEQQLVEIAKALRRRSRLMVFDEPTAALSDTEIRLLHGIVTGLAAGGTAVIYISHKLDEVLSLANRITVLRDGNDAGSGKKESWTRQRLIAAMVGREISEVFPVSRTKPGAVVLEVHGLSVLDPSREYRPVLSEVSFTLREGEILGLAGLMGSGRTEIVSALFGVPPGILSAGTVRIAGGDVRIGSPDEAIEAGLAFVPEDRKKLGLVIHRSVLENLSIAHLEEFCFGGILDSPREYQSATEIARRLDIRASSLDVQAGTLSGGNQQKIVVGKWLSKNPRILLLDEPTRGIDVGAKVEMYHLINGLKESGVAIILVSSELPEILGLCDRILVIKGGMVAGELTTGEANQEKIMELAV